LIHNLIEHAKAAVEERDVDKANTFALKAVDLVHREKIVFLKGASTERTGQQLADWFRDCSFLFNKVM